MQIKLIVILTGLLSLTACTGKTLLTAPNIIYILAEYLGNPLTTPVGFLDEPLGVMPVRNEITRRIETAGLPVEKADVLWLEETGELANTVIFFMNDHAVENGKGSLYQGGIFTTGFVWGPDYLESGTRVEQMVANIDLVPTVFELCGIEVPKDYHLDGKSFYSILKVSTQVEELQSELRHYLEDLPGDFAEFTQ